MADYYNQGANATFGANYQTPDWMRTAGGSFMQDRDATNAFFAANPQYAEDWGKITSGGTSGFSTDGTGLVKTDLNTLPSGVADYYRQNPNELLAAEGFGYDPTLQYMNYYQGPASIGVNPKRENVADYMSKNKWTPNGIVAGNTLADNSGRAFGAGTASLNSAQYGSTRAPTKPYMGGSSAGGGSYGSGSMNSTYQQNPYAQQMAGTLAQQIGEQFQRQIQPQISQSAIAAGGYGGSRQGVLEANAANDLQQNTGQAVGTMLGNMYGQDLSYNLGMGNLGLGYANLDRSINNDNNQWGLQGAQLGMQLQDRQLQQNQLGLSNGSQINDNAYNNWNRYSQGANSIGQGYGSQTQSGGGGNTMMGMLGGAQLGNQLGKQVGNWWDSNQSMTGNGGWGTGNSYGNQDFGNYF